MSESLQFFSRSNLSELRSDHFQVWLCRPAGINKDPSVWVDEVRPLPKYVFKNDMSSKNSDATANFPMWCLITVDTELFSKVTL